MLYLLFSVISFIVLFKIKYYIAAVFIAVALPIIIMDRCQWILGSRFKNIMVFSGLFLILVLLVSFLHPNLYIENVLQSLYQNSSDIIKTSNVTAIVDTGYDGGVISFLSAVPKGLINVFFRPMLGDGGGGVAMYAAAVENFLLFILIILALITIYKQKSKIDFVHLGLFCYVLVLAILIGVSSPNIGALIRYRIYFLPIITMFAFSRLMTANLVWDKSGIRDKSESSK